MALRVLIQVGPIPPAYILWAADVSWAPFSLSSVCDGTGVARIALTSPHP